MELRLHARLPPAAPPPLPLPYAPLAVLPGLRTGRDSLQPNHRSSSRSRCTNSSSRLWISREHAALLTAIVLTVEASFGSLNNCGRQVVAVKERSVSVILLSGGQGKRMGASMPKQYLPLLGLPIALHSLKTFCQLMEVKEVVVVCDPDYKDIFEGSIDNLHIPLKFACPGKERQDSVFNGLQEIDASSELVCVHDSARPLVSSKDVKKVLEDAAVHGAAVLGVPVKATIKEANSDSFVIKTLDRKTLWEMQTPQVMKPNLLRDGFELVNRDGLEVTDDVSIVEYLKHPVFITEGSYTNIKVTTPDDLLLAERLMNEK
ncbi:hypothetical protein PR202_ga08695 [Eleusine coracana subsp. coracana]|uniref:2-C-methyl-D-erythritol 4-phosphate cytidylyltransferase, chloroplastic n=1 Tax=Eleusine coracana subsp. coracana TaxID=191504 RepID=A0AAV5C0X7_ELECO|nr:hypothetical protein PR202_ga08695 [Eleusine coracana subsp. coracana]